MSKGSLTIREQQQIQAAWMAGVRLAILSQHFGYSKSYIWKIANNKYLSYANGLKKPNRLNKADKRRIQFLKNEGHSIDTIAAEYKASRSTILKALRGA